MSTPGETKQIEADEKVCRNCRYLSCHAGSKLRCADPAAHEFNREVAARGSCGRFQISFKAVRQMALDQKSAARQDAWDMPMTRRAQNNRIIAP
ncbi:MAG: hypothetical protein RIQ68_1021 [Pseudomonadota bacterium]|jgi:hypothetical protein